MPLYNGKEFLQESINSVIAQTYPNWELLIGINGLLWEDAKNIFQQMTTWQDNRIIVFYFSDRDKGKVKTLNKLVQSAHYNIIGLLDVDDYWFPTKLEKQIPYLEKYDVIGSGFEYFGDKTDTPPIFLGEITPQMFSYQNPIVNSSVLLKKADAYWEESWEGLDDFNLWIDLLNREKTFYNVAEILIKHRIHKGSYFNNFNNEEMAQQLKINKIPILTGGQRNELSKILDRKKWKL
jgi:teichuronic acid biosynthesis glycosyltransferase TuaG